MPPSACSTTSKNRCPCPAERGRPCRELEGGALEQPDRRRTADRPVDPRDRRRRRPDDGGGGRGDPMGVHGFIVIAFAGALFVVVGKKIYAPEPREDRFASYYDDPTKAGIIISLVWAVIGMGMGVWVASQLAWPDLRFDAAWSSFAGCARCTPRRDLRLWRQRTDRHLLPRDAAYRPRPAAGPARPGSCCSASTCSASSPPAAT